MYSFDQPERSAAVDALIETLDTTDLAAKSNALTGGCLREEDLVKVIKLVAMTAIRTPGLEVIVAGVGASWDGKDLSLFLAAEVATSTLEPVLS